MGTLRLDAVYPYDSALLRNGDFSIPLPTASDISLLLTVNQWSHCVLVGTECLKYLKTKHQPIAWINTSGAKW